MKTKILLFILISIISINISAQSKKDIKAAKKLSKKADKLLFKEDIPKYNEALDLLLQAYKHTPDDPALNYKIGAIYLNTIKKTNAIPHLEKAVAQASENPDVYYLLGKAYHLNYQFAEAVEQYEKYLNSLTPKQLQNKKVSRIAYTPFTDKPPFELSEEIPVANIGKTVRKRVEEAGYAKELVENPVEVKIDNLGADVNSPYPDYVPVITADESELYFTARRPSTMGGGRDEIDGLFYEDIYFSKKVNDKWIKAQPMDKTINTKSHDAAVGLSADGQTLIIYRDEKGGDLYESKFKKGEWSKPRHMKEINTNWAEKSAAISADGNLLFFTSNRKDGHGGLDIYMSKKDKKGNWGEPKNLGATINTEYDEDGVFFHPNGKTLYFSSKGHNTMGGFDIFKSDLIDGAWTKPENLGYPINSPDDDIYFVLSASGKYGYYSSTREDGMGEKDLYMITMELPKPKPVVVAENEEEQPEPEPVNPVTLLTGVVTDEETGKPVEAAIEVIDNEADEVISEFSSNSGTGKFLVALPSGKNYGIAVRNDAYLFHSENFDIPATTDYNEVRKDVALKKIKIGKKVVLRNIFYDFNKATLRPESKSELERLAKLLNDNPKIKVEISGHTDSQGSDDYNQKLSEERAQSVVSYLVENGIKADRLIAKGYGESQPIDTNDTEEGRQQNRRTEFKILEN